MKKELESKIQKLTDLNNIFQRKLEISDRKIKGLEDQNLISNLKIIELQKFKEEHEVTEQKLEKENYRLRQSFKEKTI